MDTVLTLRGVFSAEGPDAPLDFEQRSTPLSNAKGALVSGLEAELAIALRTGTALCAIAAQEQELAFCLLDGRGGAWLIQGYAMVGYLRTCLDHISDAAGGLPSDWGLVLIVGLSQKLPADKAGELESLAVRAASKASAGRYLLGFVGATLEDCRLISHIFSEQEVTAILTGTFPKPIEAGWA